MWSKAECRDLGERGGSDPVVGTFLKERGPRFLPRVTRCAHVSWKPVQSAFTQPIFSPQELFLVFKEEKKKAKKKKTPSQPGSSPIVRQKQFLQRAHPLLLLVGSSWGSPP